MVALPAIMNADGPGPLRRALRNTSYVLSGKAAGGVLGFATTAIAARALGMHGLGILLLIHAFAGSVCALTRLQSWQPLLQFGSDPFHAGRKEEFHSLLRHCILLDGLGAGAGAVLGMPIVWLAGPRLGWGGHGIAAVIYVSSILFMNTGAALGLMRLTDRFGTAAMADTAGAAVRFAGSLLGIVLHWRLDGFLAVWYVSTVTAFSIDAWAMRRIIGATPDLKEFRLIGARWLSRLPGFWKFTFTTSGNQTLIDLSSKIGILVVGAALGPNDAAFFRVAAQLSGAVSEPAQLLMPALYPEFVRLRDSREPKRMRSIVFRVFAGLALFSALILLLMNFAGPFLLALLLAARHSHALPLLLLMTAAALLDIWDVPLEPLLASLGQARKLLNGRLAGMLLSLPLLYFFSKLWGLGGAAAAVLAGETVIFLTRLIPFLQMSGNPGRR